MSRCFAQILPRYLHFDFSLICCIVTVCCTRTISLCSPTKGETGHPKKFVRAHWIHAELSLVCTTPLSIHLKASAHSSTPTESSSLRHKRKVLCDHSHTVLSILFPKGRTNLHKLAAAMNLYIFKFTTFHWGIAFCMRRDTPDHAAPPLTCISCTWWWILAGSAP